MKTWNFAGALAHWGSKAQGDENREAGMAQSESFGHGKDLGQHPHCGGKLVQSLCEFGGLGELPSLGDLSQMQEM